MRTIFILLLVSLSFAGTSNVRIYRQAQAALSSLQNQQIGVNTSADANLGFKMWGGKDADGNITQWLAKDKNARVLSMRQDSSFSKVDTAWKYKGDTAFITGLKSTRLYYSLARGDTTRSVYDTAKIMKADSANFTKVRVTTCYLTTIDVDSIHTRKVVFTPTTEPTVNGALVYDSTNTTFCSFSNGITGHFNRTLFTTTADMKDSNTTTDTNIIGTGTGTSLLPANWFRPGKRLKMRLVGYFTTKTPTPGAVTITIKLGSTTILTTGAVTFSAGALGNYWQIDAAITCRTAGAPGTVAGSSCFMFQDAAAGNDPILGAPMINKTPVSLTTTGTLQYGLFVKWATADVANLFVCTSLILEEIN